MTDKEALALVDDYILKGMIIPEIFTDSFWYIIREVLEKHIPKKPDESYDGFADGYPVIDYSCPNCGRELDDTDHHCVCGQHIDWSEE